MARRLDHIRERPSGSRCGGELDLDGLTQPDPDVQVRRYFGPGLATHREAILGETPPRQDLPPVIRIEPSAGRTVTWAGFVEAGLLRTYRNARMPMTEPHRLPRAKLGVAYPLAHHRPYVGGRNLVMQSQDQGLDRRFCLIAVAGGQIILTGPSQTFGDRVGADNSVRMWLSRNDGSAHLIRIDRQRADLCENHTRSTLSLLVWFWSSGQATVAGTGATTSPATSGPPSTANPSVIFGPSESITLVR